MIEDLIPVLSSIVTGIAFLVLALIVLAIAALVKDLMTSYDLKEQLTKKDNHALGLSLTGYYIGVIIIFIGAVYDPTPNVAATELWTMTFMYQVLEVLGYSLGGVLFLNLSRIIVDKLVLNKFSTEKEIIEDRNSGTGAVEFGSYVASALVLAGSISGSVLPQVVDGKVVSTPPWWMGIVVAIGLYFLAQLVLVVFAKFYQIITNYDIHEQIEADNVSAGVAFGGNLIGIGLILFKGVAGNFEDWASHIVEFALWAAVGFVILFMMRIIVDKLFLPDSTIAHEIATDKNLNAGMLEGAMVIGIASLIFFIL